MFLLMGIIILARLIKLVGMNTRYVYDKLNRLKEVCENNAFVAGYTHDANDLFKSDINTYDLDGNMATKSDYDNKVTAYEYDGLGVGSSMMCYSKDLKQRQPIKRSYRAKIILASMNIQLSAEISKGEVCTHLISMLCFFKNAIAFFRKHMEGYVFASSESFQVS